MKKYETILTFDTETSGVDVETDRIVTAFIGLMDREGNFIREWNFLLNPEIEIPDGASAVHGVTTEVAQRDGTDWKQGLADIRSILEEHSDVPLVIFNAPYDTTILDRNLRTAGLGGYKPAPFVFDPLVVDKQTDKWRKGSRKLVDMARHYGIQVDEASAHAASYDCWMAGLLAWKLMPEKMSEEAAVRMQAKWKREQAESFQAYLRREKDPDAVIDGNWPIIPA